MNNLIITDESKHGNIKDAISAWNQYGNELITNPELFIFNHGYVFFQSGIYHEITLVLKKADNE